MGHNTKLRYIILQVYTLFILIGFLSVPTLTLASSQDVAVWIPWWSEEEGIASALQNINDIDVLHPFVFEVLSDGSINNKVDFTDKVWRRLFVEAKNERVDVIPTIVWFNGVEMQTILSDDEARRDHIKEIVAMVKENRFAGVNIDYEAKLAETKDHFSDFLRELDKALGKSRKLTCTVEARTPPESRWREVPEKIEYANDYKAMNRYCDYVEIMAYDQQRADLKLNDARKGVPYMPVADTEWVEKVLKLALKDFSRNKVMLGVATYGRAWDVLVAPNWYKDYTAVAALNQPRILELAEKYEAPIGRTEAGEGVITYFPEGSKWEVINSLPLPEDALKGFEAAARALMVANYGGVEVPVRFVSWSDAKAIEEKVDLAKKYKLRGLSVFKVDGEEDPDMWDLF